MELMPKQVFAAWGRLGPRGAEVRLRGAEWG